MYSCVVISITVSQCQLLVDRNVCTTRVKRSLKLLRGFVDRHTKTNDALKGTAKFDMERGNSITRCPVIRVRICGLTTLHVEDIKFLNRHGKQLSASWATQCLIEFMARIHDRTSSPISRSNSIDSIPPCQYSRITPWENENCLLPFAIIPICI